ncbi:MAG: O-antigen ligase family protein [Ruminococcus sp.]|nr:O-antigen ligase family protein [Ruminococcus sp.]
MSKKTKKTIGGVAVPELPRYREIFTKIVICALLFAVFTVRLHIEKLTGRSLEVFANTNGLYADWFLYCKEIVYLVIACGVCLYAVGERIFPDKPCRENRLFTRRALLPALCVGAYLLFACISALFSEHKEVVLFGLCTEFEGLLAIFSYCIIFLFGFNYIIGERLKVFFRRAVIALTAVAAAFAVFEYTVSPLMELPFVKFLIAPAKYRAAAESLAIGNDFRESVLTFYNSNYTGEFFVLVFPIAVYAVFAAKKAASRIAAGALAAAVFAAGIMTNATAAFYVIAAELVCLLAFFIFKRVIPLKAVLAAAAAFAVLTVGLDLCTGHDFTSNIIKSITNAGTYESAPSVYTLKSAEIRGRELHIAAEGSGYTIMPPYESGETLSATSDSGVRYTADSSDRTRLLIRDDAQDANISVVLVEGIMYVDLGYKSSLDFAVTTDGLRLIAQNRSLLGEIPVAPMADSSLVRYYGFATGRGYIWANSLPILKECIVVGKGMGGFPFEFVQNDVVGLCNTNGTYRLVVDKPHCRYLQIALTCGIPALIAIIVLLGAFLLGCAKNALKWSRDDLLADRNRLFFVCLCAGIVGFLAEGIVNDGNITVEPIFWLFLGAAHGMLLDFGKEKANA